MRRSSYKQIIDWKARRGDHPRPVMEFVAQIESLSADAGSVGDVSSQFVEFVPIRLVTILEVFLRDVISELIDGGEAYFERGERLAKGAKIDLTFAAHVDRRELTIGDFVAHAVSVNGADGVVSVLDTLLENFVPKLRKAHPRWSEDRATWPLPPIINDYDRMMASLARLYEVRNVLTHELPSSPIFKPAEVVLLAASAREFIEATDWLVVEALHGDVPRTQASMSANAGDVLREEEAKLAALLSEVTGLDGIDHEALHDLQAAWATWANAQANLVASQFEGGTIYPMIWASEKAELTRERVDQLTRLKIEWMGY